MREDQEMAFLAYKQCGTIEGTYTLCKGAIKISTLERWRDDLKWDELAKDKKSKDLQDTNKITDELEVFMKRFGVSDKWHSTLKGINVVEGIAISTLTGKPLPEGFMPPKSFNDAVKGLKTCWEAKQKIFAGLSDDTEKKQKPNYLVDVHHHHGNTYIGSTPGTSPGSLLRKIQGKESTRKESQPLTVGKKPN